MSVSHRLFDSKHRLSKQSQLVVVQVLRVQRPPPWTVPMRTRCCCRGSWSVSSLSCAARFIFFMEGTGMSEASERAPTLLTEARLVLQANFLGCKHGRGLYCFMKILPDKKKPKIKR